MSEKEYYSISKLKDKNCRINLIIGERSNGKSYQIKHEVLFKDYFDSIKINPEEPHRFLYVRRFEKETKRILVEKYFDDVNIAKISNGKYTGIVAYGGEIYLGNLNAKGKAVREELVGYYCSLVDEQDMAGGSFLDVYNIVFEEFISRKYYLNGNHEPNKLMNLYCTVDRKRLTTKLWLAGNTISKICPYFSEWHLDKHLKHMKPGDFNIFNIPTGEGAETVSVALEYTGSMGVSSGVIGSASKMMNSGEWQTDKQPRPLSTKNTELILLVGFDFSTFKFMGECRVDESGYIFWVIYDFTHYEKEFNDDILIISDKVIMKPNYFRDIYNVGTSNKRIKAVLNTFTESNIFYVSDEVGTDFKQAIDFMIRK